jgi:hypothetical protein
MTIKGGARRGEGGKERMIRCNYDGNTFCIYV